MERESQFAEMSALPFPMHALAAALAARRSAADASSSTSIGTSSLGTSLSAAAPRLRSPGTPTGLTNQGATCYLNSLLQALFCLGDVRRCLLGFAYDASRHGVERRCVTRQLQYLFARLELSAAAAVATSDLTRSFGWERSEAFVQNDVHECLVVLLDALAREMAGMPTAVTLASVASGVLEQFIACEGGCGRQTSRAEPFTSLSLPVRGCADVTEALRAALAEEALSGDNAYACEACGGKRDARKGARLPAASLPPTLFLHLNRHEWDPSTLGRRKITDALRPVLELDMRPFVWQPAAPAAPAAPLLYELVACMLHVGSASAGHYFSYARVAPAESPAGAAAQPRWVSFNDSTVSEIAPEQLPRALGQQAPPASAGAGAGAPGAGAPGAGAPGAGAPGVGAGAGATSAPPPPPAAPLQDAAAAAYMLVYRRADTLAEMLAHTPRGATPADVRALVEAENARLLEAAARAEAERSRLRFRVVLLPAPAAAATASAAAPISTPTTAPAPALPSPRSPGPSTSPRAQEVCIDREASLGALLRAAVAACAPAGAAGEPSLWRLRAWDAPSGQPQEVLVQAAEAPGAGAPREVQAGEAEAPGAGAPPEEAIAQAAAEAPGLEAQVASQAALFCAGEGPAAGRPRALALERRRDARAPWEAWEGPPLEVSVVVVRPRAEAPPAEAEAEAPSALEPCARAGGAEGQSDGLSEEQRAAAPPEGPLSALSFSAPLRLRLPRREATVGGLRRALARSLRLDSGGGRTEELLLALLPSAPGAPALLLEEEAQGLGCAAGGGGAGAPGAGGAAGGPPPLLLPPGALLHAEVLPPLARGAGAGAGAGADAGADAGAPPPPASSRSALLPAWELQLHAMRLRVHLAPPLCARALTLTLSLDGRSPLRALRAALSAGAGLPPGSFRLSRGAGAGGEELSAEAAPLRSLRLGDGELWALPGAPLPEGHVGLSIALAEAPEALGGGAGGWALTPLGDLQLPAAATALEVKRAAWEAWFAPGAQGRAAAGAPVAAPTAPHSASDSAPAPPQRSLPSPAHLRLREPPAGAPPACGPSSAPRLGRMIPDDASPAAGRPGRGPGALLLEPLPAAEASGEGDGLVALLRWRPPAAGEEAPRAHAIALPPDPRGEAQGGRAGGLSAPRELLLRARAPPAQFWAAAQATMAECTAAEAAAAAALAPAAEAAAEAALAAAAEAAAQAPAAEAAAAEELLLAEARTAREAAVPEELLVAEARTWQLADAAALWRLRWAPLAPLLAEGGAAPAPCATPQPSPPAPRLPLDLHEGPGASPHAIPAAPAPGAPPQAGAPPPRALRLSPGDTLLFLSAREWRAGGGARCAGAGAGSGPGGGTGASTARREESFRIFTPAEQEAREAARAAADEAEEALRRAARAQAAAGAGAPGGGEGADPALATLLRVGVPAEQLQARRATLAALQR